MRRVETNLNRVVRTAESMRLTLQGNVLHQLVKDLPEIKAKAEELDTLLQGK